MTKNIFGGQSARALFVHYVYEELRKREFVSLVDVLCIYYKRDKSYYDLHTYSSDKAYIQLKKAFPEVIKALEKAEPDCVKENGKTGKGKAYCYIGKDDGITGRFFDPLKMADVIIMNGIKNVIEIK
jgi:hypothetical protein